MLKLFYSTRARRKVLKRWSTLPETTVRGRLGKQCPPEIHKGGGGENCLFGGIGNGKPDELLRGSRRECKRNLEQELGRLCFRK